MILLDYSGISISAIMGNHYGNNELLDEDLVKHIILNSIRKYNVKFRKYGQMVLCCDSGNNWRKVIYPEYKANRKTTGDATIDWEMIYAMMDLVLVDVSESFPFDVYKVNTFEADDLIAYLSMYYSSYDNPSMIVSGDHDFQDQLLMFSGVNIYSPKLKKEIKVTREEALMMKKTHIIRGCSGDGVPNILSDNDTFINPDKRQKPMRQKRLDELLGLSEKQLLNTLTEDQKNNYERNKAVVTFDNWTEEQIDVMENHYDEVIKSRNSFSLNSLMTYFAKNKMRYLASCIKDFGSHKSINQSPLTAFLK